MAFRKIVTDVAAYFLEVGCTAVVAAGWKERAKTINQGPGSANRVVFTPISPMNPIAPTHIGEELDGTPRQLFNVLFNYEISIWGYDPDEGGQNDLLHIAKCMQLLELIAQAVQRGNYGTITYAPMRWTVDVKTIRHGAELIVPITINVPVLDVAPTFHVAHATTHKHGTP